MPQRDLHGIGVEASQEEKTKESCRKDAHVIEKHQVGRYFTFRRVIHGGRQIVDRVKEDGNPRCELYETMKAAIDILNNMQGVEVVAPFGVSTKDVLENDAKRITDAGVGTVAVDEQKVDKINLLCWLLLSISVFYDYVIVCVRNDLYDFVYIYLNSGLCVKEYLCCLSDMNTERSFNCLSCGCNALLFRCC